MKTGSDALTSMAAGTLLGFVVAVLVAFGIALTPELLHAVARAMAIADRFDMPALAGAGFILCLCGLLCSSALADIAGDVEEFGAKRAALLRKVYATAAAFAMGIAAATIVRATGSGAPWVILLVGAGAGLLCLGVALIALRNRFWHETNESVEHRIAVGRNHWRSPEPH